MFIALAALALSFYPLLLWALFSADVWSRWSEVPGLCFRWWRRLLLQVFFTSMRGIVWAMLGFVLVALAALASYGLFGWLGTVGYPVVAFMTVVVICYHVSRPSVRSRLAPH